MPRLLTMLHSFYSALQPYGASRVAWATAGCAISDSPCPALPRQRVCSCRPGHATLTSRPIPLQGIERLQRKTQPREHSGSWKSVQEAFGGDFSLNWFNPFTRPCQPEIPVDKGLVRQVSSLSDMDNMETTESQLEETKDRDSVEVLDE